MSPQDLLRDRDHIVEPSCGLQCGESRDDRDDHPDRDLRRAAWWQAKEEYKYSEPDAGDSAKRDSSQSRANKDACQKDAQLNPDHQFKSKR
jgi:hypothetical protein